MNASRFASLSAAFTAVALAAGCAYDRDNRAMQTTAPLTPVAAAPTVQQPDPTVIYAPAPLPMATAAADPVMAVTQPVAVAAAPYPDRYNNIVTERAPRADRN